VTLLGDARRRFGPRPIDWSRGAGRAAAARPRSVDVIVPVYGAAGELRECLASIARQTDLGVHGVVLVIDGPQDAAVDAIVSAFAAAHGAAVRVLRNERRLGFVGSVNRGMRASTADVVLLNSDTIVTSRWLEKLLDAATSSGDVGTVTPLSNHATLCCVPRAFEENLLPSGFDVSSLAALVERVSAREYPRLPTAVGVCMFIRRALLEDVGFFDEEHFGFGYGEENDFCMRALARGWVHVADDATFIFHAGHRSFGASRARLQKSAAKALARLHPAYMATIAEFMRRDPLAPARRRILVALGAAQGAMPKVVHLVHGSPPFQQAGTELYAYWLVQQQRAKYDVAVYTRSADIARGDGEVVELMDEGVRVRLVTNHFTARNPLRRNAIRDRALERDFERFLREERPRLLHVHHLAGHAFSLMRVARRLGIPIVLQIQDWWFLCARVNLFDRDRNRCTGPAPEKCAACATLTKVPPAAMSNRLVHLARRVEARAAIAAADAYVVGSKAIRDDYVRAGVIPPGKPVQVIPYGVAVVAQRGTRAAAARPIRFGYVGSIAPHKGLHVAAEAMRGFDPAEASLHVWGDGSANPDYVEELRARAGGAALVFEGRFAEEEKGKVFAAMDVLLVPSVGLESFGLAAREAMTCGVPVIASAGGALSEMFEPGTCGELFPAGDAAALARILRRVVDDPSLVDRWSSRIVPPKSEETHAAEIERVYAAVLAR
jgi:glycosyltransferase involved in cell wall biosynthesis/GT2 family glycosyltransferase